MNRAGQYSLLKRHIGDLGDKLLSSGYVRIGSKDEIRLARWLDCLARDIYRVTVVGEVSAGKSSFVNALLGRDLLPHDVRQCSNAVVEISHGERVHCRVLFADGSEKSYSSDEDSSESVVQVAEFRGFTSLQDRFREIPTGLIDSFVVAGKPVPTLRRLEELSGYKLVDHEDTVEDYINNWARPSNIPLEIQVTIPFTDGMRPLTIVDTPGVNAIGGIQDKTWDFLDCSDAVVVMCSIKRHELITFQDLVLKCVAEFGPENVYVVLTHSALCSKSDKERLLAEARQLLCAIHADRIVAVDNVLCCLEQEARQHGLQRIMDDDRKFDSLAHLIRPRISAESAFLDLVRNESNFDAIRTQLARLGRRVPTTLVTRVIDASATILARVPESLEKVELQKQLHGAEEMADDFRIFGEGLVLFGGKEGLFAVDKDSGDLKWRHKTQTTVISELVFQCGLVIFGCFDGTLRALDLRTGTERWTIQSQEGDLYALVAGEGIVCYGGKSKVLYAVNARDGSDIWQHNVKTSSFSAAAISERTVYFGSGDGNVHCLDIKTGRELWKFPKGDWRTSKPRIFYPETVGTYSNDGGQRT